MTTKKSPLRSSNTKPNKNLSHKKLSGRLHPKNRHQGRYDFPTLCAKTPELTSYLQDNPHGDQTIDFSNAKAVLCLNKALLAQFYAVQFFLTNNYFLKYI